MPNYQIQIEDKLKYFNKLDYVVDFQRKLTLNFNVNTQRFDTYQNSDKDLIKYVEQLCKMIADVYNLKNKEGYFINRESQTIGPTGPRNKEGDFINREPREYSNLYPLVEYTLPVKKNSGAFDRDCPVLITVEEEKDDLLNERPTEIRQVKPIAVKIKIEGELQYDEVQRRIIELSTGAFERSHFYGMEPQGTDYAYINYFKWNSWKRDTLSSRWSDTADAYIYFIKLFFDRAKQVGNYELLWKLDDDEIDEINNNWEFNYRVEREGVINLLRPNDNHSMIITISGDVKRAEKTPLLQFYDTLITDDSNVRTLYVGTDITIKELLKLKSFNIERRLIYDDYTANVMDVGCNSAGKSNIEFPVRTGPSQQQIYCATDILKWIRKKSRSLNALITDPATNQPLKKIHIMNEIDIQEQEWKDIKNAKDFLLADEAKIRSKMDKLRTNNKIPRKMADNLMVQFRSQIREIQLKLRSLPSTERELDAAKIARNDVKRLKLKF